MKKQIWMTLAAVSVLVVSCGPRGGETKHPGGEVEADASTQDAPEKSQEETMTERMTAFLEAYVPEAKRLEVAENEAYWQAYVTGSEDAYAAAEKAELERKKFHSDPEKFKEIKEILDSKALADPLLARQAVLVYNDFAENQIPADLMERMVELGTEIQKEFNTHRAKVGDTEYDRNAVKKILRTSKDNKLREEVWVSQKSIGGKIAPKVLELVKVRNEVAVQLGYANYWEMSMILQEHDPAKVTTIFEELDAATLPSYTESKAELDAVLSKRLKIKVDDLRPWHYADPFVQEAPTISAFDLDTLYAGKDLLEIARKYYSSFGLDPEPILARSDVLPKPGKSEHAFCFTVDRDVPDIRVLLNLEPNDQWMDTALHELGHAFYDDFYDPSLPWRLKEPSHILTTEGVAQLFGEMSKNTIWLKTTLEIPDKTMPKVTDAAEESRVLQQLVFARWSLVMFHFEKALYSNPDQALNTLWWALVEKYQLVNRPDGRNEPDWATKDHVVVAPVYYHNYVMGQMFKAQVIEALAKETGKANPLEVTFIGDETAGRFLVDKVFKPGSSKHFMEMTVDITGEPFSAAAYGRSFGWGKDAAAGGKTKGKAKAGKKGKAD